MSKNNDSAFANTMKEMFDGILASVKTEAFKKHPEVFATALEKFDINKSDEYWLFQIHGGIQAQECALEIAIKANYPTIKETDIFKITTVFMNHSIIDQFLSDLISKQEGSACSSDKSGHIINRYLRTLVGYNQRRQSIPSDRLNYWEPCLGTWDNWFKLIDSYIRALHARPKDLVEFYPHFISHIESEETKEMRSISDSFKTKQYLQKKAEKSKSLEEIFEDRWVNARSEELKNYTSEYFLKIQNKKEAPEQILYLERWVSSLSQEIKDKGFVIFFTGFEHRYSSKELNAMYEAWYL